MKKFDKILFISVILLSLFGLFNLVTASSREAVTNLDESIYYYFYRHLIILFISLIASLFVLKTPLKKYYKCLPIMFIIFFVLNSYLVIKGQTTRGAANWIRLGFFNLQPSEVSKIVMIMCLSFFLEKFNKNLLQNKQFSFS